MKTVCSIWGILDSTSPDRRFTLAVTKEALAKFEEESLA